MHSIRKLLVTTALLVAAVCTAGQAQAPTTKGDASVEGPEIVRLDPALDTLIAPGAKLEKVATGFRFTEGPMWRHGRLWFVDGPADKVRAVTANGEVTELLTSASGFPNYLGPNGMAPDKDGSVVMCEQAGRRVVRLVGADGALKVETLFETYDGKRLNSPNDIVFAKDGSFYLTDPPYGLKGMDKDPAKELPFNGVFRYANGKLTLIVKDLTLPNGINLSPDGRTLYVNNSGPHMMTMKYPVEHDGTVGAGSIFAEFSKKQGKGVPDGMKLDAHGNIWTTSPGGPRIFTPEGRELGQIKVPEVAANLAWGDDGRTLYITASTSVYKLRTQVMGKLPLYAK